MRAVLHASLAVAASPCLFYLVAIEQWPLAWLMGISMGFCIFRAIDAVLLDRKIEELRAKAAAYEDRCEKETHGL